MNGLRNYTAYVICNSTEQLIASIVAICEREGMRRVKECQGRLRNSPALECNDWAVSVFKGAPGWHVLTSEPWDLWSDRAPGSPSSRLAQLCAQLRTGAFALHISHGNPWGQVLLEADGRGQEHLSGWWHDSDNRASGASGASGYLGAPVGNSPQEVRFGMLKRLQPLLDDGRDFARSRIRADSDDERACEHIARELGGTSAVSWPEWTSRPGISQVLHFTWPARDRPEPPPSEFGLALQEFDSAPRFFYFDGSAISKGDAVLFDGGLFPAEVVGFLVGHIDGKPRPAGVLVNDGEPGQRVVESDPGSADRFSSLQFVERNTTDFMLAGVSWLQKKAAGGNAAAQFSLGNLYVSGIGVAQDNKEALAWWRKSADKGLALAQYWLGVMYHDGHGVPADREQAMRWWARAAEQGHAEASQRLDAMLRNPGGGRP